MRQSRADGARRRLQVLNSLRVSDRRSAALYKPSWQHVLGLGTGFLIVLFAGWIVGRTALFVACYLAVVVVIQTYQLIRFEAWLRQRNLLKPPNMGGLWGEAVATANRIHRRKMFHKRRVLMLLREFRRMTT